MVGEKTGGSVLIAQETNHGVVGRTVVTVGPTQTPSTVHEVQIKTTTLAVIGIGAAWLMGYVDFRTVVYVVAGIAIVAGAATIVNAMWGK